MLFGLITFKYSILIKVVKRRWAMIKKVIKRDGRIVDFDQSKITNAILKAIHSVGGRDGDVSKKLSSQVSRTLEHRFANKMPGVEDVQNIVEETLISSGLSDVARAYIIYRQKRAESREYKEFFGVKDDLKLDVNALKVLERRYLLKDEQGKVIETSSQLFRRVAHAIALPDKKYHGNVKETEEKFYQAMVDRKFMPNTPTLMNAGTKLGLLSACFVIPVEDSLVGIVDAVKAQVLVQQAAGGTGFSFSRLRPKGDIVKSTMGVASGPVSFMRLFDTATDVIKQAGKRRGANMGILRCDHPDVIDFITIKRDPAMLRNFNISVAATEKFMDAVDKNKDYDLINPRTKKAVKRINAKNVFELIVQNAWATGDPGMIFIDEINGRNPTKHIGEIESTNPCGEQPLHPWESCNLGSINVGKFVKGRDVDWDGLREMIRIGVHFLDNVIDANKFPLNEITKVTNTNRRIGLGVMGFAEMLIRLEIPYDSQEALDIGKLLMRFIEKEGHKISQELGKKRGNFPNFKGSLWRKKGYKSMRNATVTTIAPTGTISIIAGCSSGIEPLFAVSFVRNVMEGTKLLEVNKFFEQMARERGFYSKELMIKIAKQGSVKGMKEVPEDVRRLFVTALDIAPEWHVKMQAVFQDYTDNAVSKTINLPRDASVEDVRKAYILAWKLKCKGITIFRYGSKAEQVLYIGQEFPEEREPVVAAESEYSGGCPGYVCPH